MGDKLLMYKFKEKEYIDLITNKFIKPTNFWNTEMFPGDWNRYKEEIKMLDKVDLELNSMCKVLDLGSPLPFVTYYIRLRYGCEVYCKDIGILNEYDIDKVKGIQFNVCTENLGLQEWDFICFTDVLEHLPCNLYLVREKVISSLKDNRYLLISYPLGSNMIAPYGKDILDTNWNVTHGHMREFPNDNAIRFISNLKVIDKSKVIAPSYDLGSMQILYKKEFV